MSATTPLSGGRRTSQSFWSGVSQIVVISPHPSPVSFLVRWKADNAAGAAALPSSSHSFYSSSARAHLALRSFPHSKPSLDPKKQGFNLPCNEMLYNVSGRGIYMWQRVRVTRKNIKTGSLLPKTDICCQMVPKLTGRREDRYTQRGC